MKQSRRRRRTDLSTTEQDRKGPQLVSLADEESVKQIIVSTVFGLWDIVA
jgi:hypothetical protein